MSYQGNGWYHERCLLGFFADSVVVIAGRPLPAAPSTVAVPNDLNDLNKLCHGVVLIQYIEMVRLNLQ